MIPHLHRYDAFLSHSHQDAKIVKDIAQRLQTYGIKVWFDQRNIEGGDVFQDNMSNGLEQSEACVIFIGRRKPHGWFKKEIDYALNLHSKNPNYRVIPVLLQGAETENITGFLKLHSWVDLRNCFDQTESISLLVNTIRGIKNIEEPKSILSLFEGDNSSNRGITSKDDLDILFIVSAFGSRGCSLDHLQKVFGKPASYIQTRIDGLVSLGLLSSNRIFGQNNLYLITPEGRKLNQAQ